MELCCGGMELFSSKPSLERLSDDAAAQAAQAEAHEQGLGQYLMQHSRHSRRNSTHQGTYSRMCRHRVYKSM